MLVYDSSKDRSQETNRSDTFLPLARRNDWIYNGLDCCITYEVFNKIKPKLDEVSKKIYDFERDCLAPAMEMSLRGIAVDIDERDKFVVDLSQKADRVTYILDTLCMETIGRKVNPASPKQMNHFFYQVLKLPKQYNFKGGRRSLTTDRNALEKLSAYFIAQPFINCMLKSRELKKKISVLKTAIDPDNRIRTSYNVGGPETGRWSSSENAFHTGTNLQNIEEYLRRIFVADKGRKMGVIDLEQAESRAVGVICWMLFGDRTYLDACESGDLHTAVCQLVWPELDYGDDPRAAADQIFYRQFTYRDMSKRGGHGTNYYGQSHTMAKHLKVEEYIMKGFQRKYFKQFPAIRKYHRWTAKELLTTQCLTTPFGRRRHFFGRPDDDATLREAIAYLPQSLVADILNQGMLNIWKNISDADLYAQIHDAVMVQWDESIPDEVIIPQLLKEIEVPFIFTHEGKEYPFKIPAEIKVGWNWGYYDKKDPDKNPDGLRTWNGKDERTRRGDPFANFMDRTLS